MKMPKVLIGWLFGSTYVFAGLSKALHFNEFCSTIFTFHLVPESFITSIAVIIVTVEIVFGIGLFFQIKPHICARVLCVLTIFFTVVIILAMVENIQTDCGCFGGLIESEIGWRSLVRNLILIVGLLWITRERRMQKNDLLFFQNHPD
jgi:uncharacterized membrane protein YphA (DoxX/SURF4 family)